MRVCPYCGYEGDETATICADCHQPLSPPARKPKTQPGLKLVAPAPDSIEPSEDTPLSSGFASFIGDALGIAGPVLLFLLGAGLDLAIGFGIAAVYPLEVGTTICPLFIGMLALGLALVFNKKTRPLGFGLMAGAFTFPIWAASACTPGPLYYR